MVVSGGTLARPSQQRRSAALPAALAVVAIAMAALLAVGRLDGQAVRVAAAGFACWLSWRGLVAAGSHRERRVRAWISFALVVWGLSEALRLARVPGTEGALFAGLTVVGLSIGAIGTYVSAARGRMRSADEAALYLDAASIFLTFTAAVLIVGAGLVSDPVAMDVLVHAAFFVAIVCSTLLLDLSTRVPLRIVGPWELLVGLALVAVGYVGLSVPTTDASVRMALNLLVAVGVVAGAHGGANWTATEDVGARYRAIAGWLRGLLPLGSAILTGVLVVMLISQPMLVAGLLRLAIGIALGLVVVCVIGRQTVLLADRERVIDRERELTDELTVAEAQYRSVVERVPGVVYVAEAGQHGRWHFVSAKIEELLGYTAEEWSADPTLWINRMHPADRDRMIMAEMGETDRSEPKGRWEYRLLARDGRVVWVIDDEAVISRDADGRATMVQGILVDISDRKDLEEQLRHQALHDPLTGLPNRVLFVDRLSHALVRRGADGGVAVLFVDLDDFKDINDTLGHAAGDELLRLVAERLTGVLRAEDTACRLGGDEFAFLLEETSPMRVLRIAERILAALAETFEIGGHEATLSASVGIAIGDGSRSGSTGGEAADELLRDADTAMYAAKSHGKGRIQLFQRGMEEPVKRRRELRSALERALEGDELFLEYQPIIDMCDGGLVGVEALVRWNHPQLGRLMPADFVGMAEETGLIAGLGGWVMRRAAADLAHGSDVIVSVNVSAHQLGDGALPTLVRDTLTSSGLDPSRLLLELTESTLASAGAGAETELERVQRMGVRIALDDFGSGYSSLEYLGRLPINVLKIDRSLVERVHLEPQRQEVLRAIDHIASKLGLETIVEGIELEEQRAALLELGFCRAQGYLFAAPLPLAGALDPTPRLSPAAARR
jgi:diguanylate cyclase (GGDEF)-like protein/PAS domain S-box-containing protein